MTVEQHYLMAHHKLSIDMVIALSKLIEGKKDTYQTRSYKALHRHGLVTEDFQITDAGSKFYQSYCEMGESIAKLMEKYHSQQDQLAVTAYRNLRRQFCYTNRSGLLKTAKTTSSLLPNRLTQTQ